MSRKIKLIINIAIVLVFIPTLVFAINPTDYEPTSPKEYSEFTSIGGKIISVLQFVGIIASAIVLTIIGIKYMLGSVEEKAEYKKSMMPIVVGCAFVMCSSVFVEIIDNTLNGDEDISLEGEQYEEIVEEAKKKGEEVLDKYENNNAKMVEEYFTAYKNSYIERKNGNYKNAKYYEEMCSKILTEGDMEGSEYTEQLKEFGNWLGENYDFSANYAINYEIYVQNMDDRNKITKIDIEELAPKAYNAAEGYYSKNDFLNVIYKYYDIKKQGVFAKNNGDYKASLYYELYSNKLEDKIEDKIEEDVFYQNYLEGKKGEFEKWKENNSTPAEFESEYEDFKIVAEALEKQAKGEGDIDKSIEEKLVLVEARDDVAQYIGYNEYNNLEIIRRYWKFKEKKIAVENGKDDGSVDLFLFEYTWSTGKSHEYYGECARVLFRHIVKPLTEREQSLYDKLETEYNEKVAEYTGSN